MEKPENFLGGNYQEHSPSPAEKIRSYLKTEQEKLAKDLEEKQKNAPTEEQITISSDFRIIPPPKMYSEGHRRIVEEHLRANHGSADTAKVIEDENRRAGFMFEILKTSIMHKKIGERFIVIRSSHYDDMINKVDNVLIDRETGQTICAIDEVSPRSMRDEKADKKRREIRGRNFGFVANSNEFRSPRQTETEQGMTLKYGIELKEGKISCRELRHLPIFLLSLDQRHLNEGLKTFQDNNSLNEYEGKLSRYFLSSISLQIQELKLDPRGYANLPDDMKKRIESLESFLLGEKRLR